METILQADITYPTSLGPRLGEWIEQNYHPDWPVARGNEKGIAVHHGRLPRALGQLFVHLFNGGEVKVLICTSTLIEGVNTSAANVFIYDKKINRTDFDFFSFANIRGRVGRMMRHFVGNAFLYHQAPSEIETRVEVPVLSDPGSATDFLMMNVDRNELSTLGRQRQASLPFETGLSAEILREHGGLGVGLLQALDVRIREMLVEDPSALAWSSFPTTAQRIAIAELTLIVSQSRQERTGLFTKRQIAWAWSQLSRITTLPKFLRWFAATFFHSDQATGVDSAFQFLQACEFGFPRSLAAVQALVLNAEAESPANYGAFIVGLENWFRPTWMKELDEAGIPLPLAERLSSRLLKPESRADALKKIAALDLSSMPELDNIDHFILGVALDRS